MRKTLIAGLAALAIGLSGCGDDTTTETPAPDTPTTDAASVEPSPSEETTTDDAIEVTEEPSPEPSPTAAASDYEPIDMGTAPAEGAAPGTALTTGQHAWVSYEIDAEEEDAPADSASPAPASPAETPTEPPQTGMLGIAVLDIVEGDASFWDQFSNADEFAGNIPYFIVYQQNFNPADVPADGEPSVKALWPQFADGTDAEYLANFGITRSSDCDIELPEYDPSTGVVMSCFIGIGLPDQPIERVVYNGLEQWSIVYDESDIYVEQPLVWTKG